MVGRALFPHALRCLVACSAAATAAAQLQDIWLLGFASFTGGVWDGGESMRIAGDQMLALINAEPRILPGYRLRILWQDDRCESDLPADVLLKNAVLQEYRAFGEPPHEDTDGDGLISSSEGATALLGQAEVHPAPVGILCCSCSGGSTRTSRVAHTLRFPMVSATSVLSHLSDRTLHPNFFRTIQPQSAKIPVWCDLVPLIGISRATVLVNLQVYRQAMGEFVTMAKRAGLRLIGTDRSTEVPGLRGTLLAEAAWEAAKDAAREIGASSARVVLVFTFTNSMQLVMCAAAQQGMYALVWFPSYVDSTLWQGEAWKQVPGAICTRESILGIANGALYLDAVTWRPDLRKKLTCAPDTTVAEFRDEYYRLHEAPLGVSGADVTANVSALELGNLQADAVCMYALLLHELLMVRNRSLSHLAARSEQAYSEAVDVLGRVHFQGLQGEMRFEPGYAEPFPSSFRVAQLRAPGSPCASARHCGSPDEAELVHVAFVKGKRFRFAPEAYLKFHYPDEVYALSNLSSDLLSGMRLRAANLTDFQVCSAGEAYDPATRQCSGCPPGRVYVGTLAQCMCAPGFRDSGEACTPCEPGNYSTELGSRECTRCPLGRFAASRGSPDCTLCRVGTYASVEGSSACTPCGEGRASPSLWTSVRSVAVGSQSAGWSYAEGSESSQACRCDKGARENGEGDCVVCGEGLDCRGMGQVTVRPGYFSESSVSIYKCHGNWKRCRGGPLGATCNEGRLGLVCSECKPGRIAVQSGACEACRGTDTVVILFAVAALLALLSGAYRMFSNMMSPTSLSPALVMCVVCVGQLITALQMLNITSMLPCTWHPPTDAVMTVARQLTLNIELVRLGCLTHLPPLGRFCTRVAFIVFLLVMSLLVHCLSVLVWHRGAFWKRLHVLACLVGTWLMALYITVVSTVLTPFQCEEHPNGKYTVKQYPGVLCFEGGEYTGMVAIGAIAFICIPLPFVARCAFIVRQFPGRMRRADVSFLRMNGFLFFRFRAEAYWYFLLQVARSLAVAFVPILPGIAQAMALQFVMLVSLAFSVRFLPWCSPAGNAMESLVAAFMVFLCSFATMFADVKLWERKRLAQACTAGMGLLAAAMLIVLAQGLLQKLALRRKRFQFFLCHHKAGAGAFARLLKVSLAELSAVRRGVFLDSDNLESLRSLFQIVGYETETLVLLASRDLFRRPWCIGEMTTGRLHGVRTVLVTLPDAILPNEQLVEHCSEEIPGLECLAAEGLDMPDIQETLLWVGSLKRVLAAVGDLAVAKLSKDLVGGVFRGDSILSHKRNRISSTTPDLFILYAVGDPEVLASALVLRRLLSPHTVRTGGLPPELLEPGNVFPNCMQGMLVLLSPGILADEHCLRMLLGATHEEAQVLPISLVEGFHFPSQDELVSLGQSHGVEVAAAVSAALQEVAVSFQPQHADSETLELCTAHIARRLLNTVNQTTTLGVARTMSGSNRHSSSSTKKQWTFMMSGHRSMDI